MTVDKLYVIVDESLPAGAQLAQAGHAVANICCENQNVADVWRTTTNTIVVLEAPKNKLTMLYRRLQSDKAPATIFYEPDLFYAPTAVAAFNLDNKASSALASLMLARSEPTFYMVEWVRILKTRRLRGKARNVRYT